MYVINCSNLNIKFIMKQVPIMNPCCSPLKIKTSCACKEGGGFGKSCAFLSFNILSITKKKIRLRKSLVWSDWLLHRDNKCEGTQFLSCAFVVHHATTFCKSCKNTKMHCGLKINYKLELAIGSIQLGPCNVVGHFQWNYCAIPIHFPFICMF